MRRLATLLLLSVAATPVASQSILYVDADAAGAADGSSWTDAFPSLADAIAASASGDQIWVAAGTYRPDDGAGLTAGDRALSFEMKSGVRLHGGFAGTESSLGDRSPAENPTILSGDLAGDDDGFSLADDNVFHVVRATNASDETLLEGFVVIGGRAYGEDADSLGGGILIEGGAPWVINTRFNSNAAGCGGGVAVNGDATPTVVNTVVNGNRATLGGGVCALGAEAHVVNATISNNTALRAPGVYNSASDLNISNSIVAGNMPFDVAGHCEVWQYPCSFFHETQEVRALTRQVLAEANEVAVTEGMPAALDFLTNHPDVVQAYGNSVTLAVRVAGGSMAMLVDDQDFANSIPPPQGPGTSVGKVTQDRPDVLNLNGGETNQPRVRGSRLQTGRRTIVGDDTDGNGVVNNRDQKHALIISPFDTWDGFSAREILGATYGYSGNVDYAGAPRTIDDFDLSNWMSWSDYDYVYIGSYGATITPIITLLTRNIDPTPFHAINTGINAADFQGLFGDIEFVLALAGVRGIGLIGELDEENFSVADFNIGLGDIFFRDVYSDALSDVVIHCAYCHLGSIALEPNPQDRFVGVGWTRPILEVIEESNGIDWSVASSAALEFATQLSYGRTADLAFVGLPANVISYFNPGLIDESNVDAVRIRITELVQLTYDPARRGVPSLLADFTDVTDLVEGTLGDGEDDALNLTSLIRGLSSGTPSYELKFRVNGMEKAGTANTNEIVHIPGTDGAIDFLPWELDLNTDLVSNSIFHLEAIRDIPDGSGESVYSAVVTVDAFSCNVRTTFGGFRNGAFTGAASMNVNETDQTATLGFSSSQEVLSFPFPEFKGGAANFNAQFALSNPQLDVVDNIATIYDIDYAILNSPVFGDIWWSAYIAGDSECDDCEAWVRIDSTSEDGTRHGEFEFTGEDATATRTDKRLTTISGKFRALPGSNTDSTSPYFSCLEEYWDVAQELFD